ncbi:integrase [Streptomyces ambofaciens]
MRAAMVERFRPMVDVGAGCGLRQGEILGLSVDDIDFENGTVHMVQQLKLSLSKAVFAPPKGGNLRDVPLPDPVAEALQEHIPACGDQAPLDASERPACETATDLHRPPTAGTSGARR